MRGLATGAGAAVLLVLAFAVARTEPGEGVSFAPFVSRVEQGQLGEGRDVQAVVDRALLADEVELGSWTGETTGVWLVVDARMATTESPGLAAAELRVGDRMWRPSTRPSSGALQLTPLAAGLPMRGSLVFELPAELLEEPDAARAVLRLATDTDSRLQSVVELELDLAAMPREGRLELARAERVRW